MGARSAFSRGEEPFVPPEEVMTRLMRRESALPRSHWLDYALLAAFVAGIVAGLLLAVRG